MNRVLITSLVAFFPMEKVKRITVYPPGMTANRNADFGGSDEDFEHDWAVVIHLKDEDGVVIADSFLSRREAIQERYSYIERMKAYGIEIEHSLRADVAAEPGEVT